MKRAFNNGYGHTQEREGYEKRSKMLSHIPIDEFGIVLIGRHKDKPVALVKRIDPEWYAWARKSVANFASLADYALTGRSG